MYDFYLYGSLAAIISVSSTPRTQIGKLALDGRLTTEAEYILGHSQHEVRRLMRQAAILRPITERLLQSAGIGSGMRVLDLGCGAGDGSMLAAELVDPSGSVVGIDRSPQVIAVARERAP